MANSISQGARYLLTGVGLLRRPRVLPFVLIPLLINIALFYFGISYLYDDFAGWLDQLLASIPDWLSFIRWLLWPLFALTMLLLVAFGFTFAANLIGSPFYGLMAEQVEIILEAKTAEIPLNLKTIAAIIPKAIMRECMKLLLYLRWVIPILLLSLVALIITPLSTIMPLAWFAFGAWMLAIQYVDYCYDNHQIGVDKLRQDLRDSRSSAMGFGGATALASMVPVLNIIVVPAAVCGATAFWVEQLQPLQPGGGAINTGEEQ